MQLTRIFVTAILLTLSQLAVSAQTSGNDATKPKASQIDEFSISTSRCGDAQAHLDSAIVSLSNNPGAVMFIAIFGRKEIVPYDENLIKSHFTFRRLPLSGVVFQRIEADYRISMVQIWIVPPGANRPPFPTSIEVKPWMDEFNPREPVIFSSAYQDTVNSCVEGVPADRSGFAALLKARPQYRGKIVIYQRSNVKFRKEEKEILEFLKSNGVERARLRTSFKNNRSTGIELWILP